MKFKTKLTNYQQSYTAENTNQLIGAGRLRSKLRKGGNLVPKAEGGTKFQEEIELPEVSVTAVSTKRPGLLPGAKRFINTLNSQRSRYMLEYGMTDEEYAELLKSAVNLASVESNLGNNARYWLKETAGPGGVAIGKILKGVWNDGKALNGDFGEIPTGDDLAVSRGLTQIKYTSDIKHPKLKALYDKDGITSDNISLPEYSALATLARLKFNDKFINPKARWMGGDPMDEETRRQLYWKFGRLTDLANPKPDIWNKGMTNLNGTRRALFYNDRKVIK